MRTLALTFLATSVCLLAADSPKLRLSADIRPTRYAADLTAVPAAATFSGVIDIDVVLAKPASLVWLNATDLAIQQATVNSQPAAVEPSSSDFVALHLPAALPAGPAKIHLVYQGQISAHGAAGLFQGEDAGRQYLFTQFEALDARRTFPCFDQPDFKTPWQLTLHIRQTDKAFSNTPQLSETAEPDGMKRVVFAETKPLPSYLVAFAIGPFDVVDAGKAGRNQVPVRIVTPRGKAAQAEYAAQVTATIVDRLEDYFGVPYAYEKLDEVAIPLTFGFGAMENAGLVTYGQTILLADPATDSINRQREYASVAAHELAHQWSGDLVTTAWWNDIWLNEAFATWMSSRILAEWQPDWNTRLSDLQSKFGAMESDSLVTARQIRQPIEAKDDVANAFDGITYEKGAAVIRMFEVWTGEPQFRAGVTAYLKRYSFRNATADDFLDSIATAGKPQLAAAFKTFLDQPGIPEVSVELKCSPAPRVALSQKRYLPIGSTGSQGAQWQVPVCVRYQAGDSPATECFLLDKPSAEFPLKNASSCPAPISANSSATGYYITSYQGGLLDKLLGEGSDWLNAAERVTLLHDLKALADSGDAKESAALAAARTFANSPERQLAAQAREIVGGARDLVPPALRPNYAAFIRKTFGGRAADLGWSAKPDDDADTRLMRASLVPFVAREGDDAPLQAEARRLAIGWLDTRKGVGPDMLRAVLSTAAFSSGQELFDRLLAELKKTQDRRERRAIIGALGSSRDPKIVQQALGLLLDPQFDVREMFGLAFSGLGDLQTQSLPFEFLKAHYDEVLKRLPREGDFDAAASLPFVGGPFCDEPSRRAFVEFFQDRVANYLGGPRNYAQVLESIRLCEAQRAAQSEDVAQFFARQQ
ncbi:MAG: M1 family metallopeptidase [Bryobacteraceae bacterium]|jgi:alanyl aminopeptidase